MFFEWYLASFRNDVITKWWWILPTPSPFKLKISLEFFRSIFIVDCWHHFWTAPHSSVKRKSMKFFCLDYVELSEMKTGFKVRFERCANAFNYSQNYFRRKFRLLRLTPVFADCWTSFERQATLLCYILAMVTFWNKSMLMILSGG